MVYFSSNDHTLHLVPPSISHLHPELWQDLKEPNHSPESYTPGKLSMLKGVYKLQVKGSQPSETHPSSLLP